MNIAIYNDNHLFLVACNEAGVELYCTVDMKYILPSFNRFGDMKTTKTLKNELNILSDNIISNRKGGVGGGKKK